MAIVGTSLYETEDYICEDDKKSDKPTIWKIGVCSHKVRSYLVKLSGQIDRKEPDIEKVWDTAFETVKYGLRGCQNFSDKSDKEIKFKSHEEEFKGEKIQVVDNDFLNSIPKEQLIDLGGVIFQKNMVSEIERKNS